MFFAYKNDFKKKLLYFKHSFIFSTLFFKKGQICLHGSFIYTI